MMTCSTATLDNVAARRKSDYDDVKIAEGTDAVVQTAHAIDATRTPPISREPNFGRSSRALSEQASSPWDSIIMEYLSSGRKNRRVTTTT
jgi:hypothetical protein